MLVKTIKRALYIGSFDPFTSGHYDILLQEILNTYLGGISPIEGYMFQEDK